MFPRRNSSLRYSGQLSLRVMHHVAVALGIAMAFSLMSLIFLAIELIRDREDFD